MKGRTQTKTAIITNEKISKNKSTTENANSKRSVCSKQGGHKKIVKNNFKNV